MLFRSLPSPGAARRLGRLEPGVRALAEEAQRVVREVLPPEAVETVDGNDIGYGWTTGYTGLSAGPSSSPGHPGWPTEHGHR